MPSVGTSTTTTTATEAGAARRPAASRAAAATALQLWWRSCLRRQRSARLFALLYLLRQERVARIAAQHSSPSSPSSSAALALQVVLDTAVAYAEERGILNAQRRLLFDELLATSDVLRGATNQSRAAVAHLHPQLRHLVFLPAEALSELLGDMGAALAEAVAGCSDSAGRTADVEAALLVELRGAVGGGGAAWLLHSYCRGKVWAAAGGSAGGGHSAPALQRALEALRLRDGVDDIADVPPLPKAKFPSTAPLSSSTHHNGDDGDGERGGAKSDAVEEDAAQRTPVPLQDTSARAGGAEGGDAQPPSGADSDDENYDYSDAAYFSRRREEAARLERRLRHLLDLPEPPTEGEAGEAEAEGAEEPATTDGPQDNAHDRPRASDDDALPTPGELSDVLSPFLGQQWQQQRRDNNARGRSTTTCAVCELDGRPFSTRVAVADESTLQNDALLWPCGGCGALVHWGCAWDARLVAAGDDGDGSAVVFCSRLCQQPAGH